MIVDISTSKKTGKKDWLTDRWAVNLSISLNSKAREHFIKEEVILVDHLQHSSQTWSGFTAEIVFKKQLIKFRLIF